MDSPTSETKLANVARQLIHNAGCIEDTTKLREFVLTLVEIAEVASALIDVGLRNDGINLIVIESRDKSDPHYKLCDAIEKLESRNWSRYD